MTDPKTRLLRRLDEIAASLEQTGSGVALIGLGSVGTELDRIDAYSDLDFFAVVRPGTKAAFLDDLSWLTRIHPVDFAFRNTVDGYKLLFADNILCEFAVFEPHELSGIPFAPGRIVWKADDAPDTLAAPAQPLGAEPHPAEWQLGEALTCLYVGLGRWRRGEKLSAQRFIQHYAVDRLIQLTRQVEDEQPAFRDRFAIERRFERRFPRTAQRMASFIQGYERSPQSARAILAFLSEHFEVNPALRARILELLEGLPE